MKKYLITKATIIYEDGSKDFMRGKFETNDLCLERRKMIEEYQCKTVYFNFRIIDLFPALKLNPNEEKAIGDPSFSKVYLTPGIKTVDECIAEAFSTTVDEMKMPGKKREPTEARQFAMWWRKNNTKGTLAGIGNMYGGKDHATVIHAAKTVDILINTNRTFKAKADLALETIDRVKRI